MSAGLTDLHALDRDPRMVEVAIGISVAEGELVPCVVPGHEGQATVARRNDGHCFYRCTCDAIERDLTEVYVARVTETRERLSPQELILWHLRQAIRAGVIERRHPSRFRRFPRTAPTRS